MRVRSALPILAALSFATAAFADPPPGTIMKLTPPQEKKAAVECAHNFELQLVRSRMLETSLNLTPQQKPVFDNWRNVRSAQWKAIPCPALPMGFDIPVPQRLANQITMLSANLDGLRKELPATDALYKVLTPEQRALLDGPVKMAMPQTEPTAKPEMPPAAH